MDGLGQLFCQLFAGRTQDLAAHQVEGATYKHHNKLESGRDLTFTNIKHWLIT